MTISKILICSDFISTKEKEQASNRRWLQHILYRPIRAATSISTETFSSSLTNIDSFSRKTFFEKSAIEIDIHSTQFWYGYSDITQESKEYLSSYIGPSCLIIGYELSEATKRILDDIGVLWIDIWLHPIRYLDDVLFSFSSSNPEINNELKKYSLDEYLYYLYGDRLKVQYYKGYRRPQVKAENNSALFIGQTLNDKAICDKGKMLSLLDFKKEFERLGSKYNKVYYSRHPYVKHGDNEILEYIRSTDFAEITDENAYNLILSGKISEVASVSSSVAIEAKYLGVKSTILFKPVVDVSNDSNYSSIHQSFVNPKFWKEVLTPIFKTNESVPDIDFLNGKDKIRDMLGFYWSYRHIDKLEDIRQTLLAVDRKMQNINKNKHEKIKLENENIRGNAVSAGVSYKSFMQDIKKQFKASDIISFDIFDTLIERPFEVPNQIFDLMDLRFKALVPDEEVDFRTIRESSRSLVIKNDSEEVLLSCRYNALVDNNIISRSIADQMYSYELELEKKLCKPRAIGLELFNLAGLLKKDIILVSDIFFDKEFVQELLSLNGIKGYKHLFVSSDIGKLKHTGNLYPIVLDKIETTPSKVIHVGDNYKSDVLNSKVFGIKSLYLENNKDLVANSTTYNNVLTDKKNNVLASIIKALATQNIFRFKDFDLSRSFTQGKNYNLGYSVVGPFFLGKALWVLKNALDENVTDIYFLARDGEIVKRCYDIIAENMPGAPKSHYIMASRRSLNVASIFNYHDILDALKINFTPMPIGDLLRNRFGLEAIDNCIYIKHGFPDSRAIADIKKNKDSIISLLEDISETIINNSTRERALLLEHYKQHGLTDCEKKPLLVDIGHAGSLQKSISRLIDRKLSANYFVTSDAIKSNVLTEGLSAKGYYKEHLPPSEKEDPYNKFILLFELCFLNNKSSFIKFAENQGQIYPIYADSSRDEKRKEFSLEVHAGVCQLCKDVKNIIGTNITNYDYPSGVAVSAFEKMLREPHVKDAEIFLNLCFENNYSGRGERDIIYIDPEDREYSLSQSLWKEGAKAILNDKGNREDKLSLLDVIVKRTSTNRQWYKYKKDPKSFFADSSNPVLRKFSNFYR